jgi:hypothetical protein
MSVYSGNGAVEQAEKIVAQAETIVPPVRLSQREIVDYGTARAVTSFSVSRDNPHFLPLRDKEGKVLTLPDGRKQLSSVLASNQQMSAEILKALRTLRKANVNNATGAHDISSGGKFTLSVMGKDGAMTADVRLVAITDNPREKAENAVIFYAVYTANGYVQDALPIRAIHSVSGNR